MMPKKNNAWPHASSPVAPREQHKINQLGRSRCDPYAWMRYVPADGVRSLETLPHALRTHLQAEMAYAQEMFQSLAEDAARFRHQMARCTPEIHALQPVSSNGLQYDFSLPEGSAHRKFSRSKPGVDSEMLLDEAERAKGQSYYRATDHQPSPDDRYFAWAEDLIGNDRHRICVLDMTSGAIHTVVPEDAFGYGGFVFSSSSQYLFWIWRDACNRPTRLYRTPVMGGRTELVYEEHDPGMFMRVARLEGSGHVVLTLFGPDTSEVYLISPDAETAPAQLVQARQRGVYYEVSAWNGMLLMLTNADQAVERKLVEIDPVSFRVRRELVSHRDDVSLLSIHPFAQALVRLERVATNSRLVLMQRDGSEIVVSFDDPAYSLKLAPVQAYEGMHVRVIYQTPVNPPCWLDINVCTGDRYSVAQERLRGFDPSNYRVDRLYAQAADGQSIPMTVLSSAAAKPTDALPTLLTGYGAYGISYEPEFSLQAIALVDAGFRYVIAHVRGGSEKGQRWYQAGCRERKQDSITDFIACAHHLLKIGYAASGKIVAYGVSAGGLLVCGAMNRVPELWAGVIAQVPFVDMLNTMSDANHPLVPLLRPDWGDPLSDAKAYEHILAISPYENVRPAAYPPLLCTAGLKDDRVPYWEPAKLVANVRCHSTSGNPAILWLDPDSGHQQSDDLNSAFAQAATLWAFAKRCVDTA